MERPHGWMTSGAFAAFCGTTKETLRHYKEIGLLVPAHQWGNGYFYYDTAQFYDFYAISIFRRTGTPLEETRRCLQGQDSAGTLSLLRKQQARLEAERRQLGQMQFVLSGILRNLEWGAAPDLSPRTAWFEAEQLLALPTAELERLVPGSAEADEILIAVLERCRALCGQYDVQTDFQLGAVHRPSLPVGRETITHLYTRVREKTGSPYDLEKPAGQYLYLCCQGRWDISDGYAALDRCIQERQLKTAGCVYACDLAGFILNGLEQNAVSMISVRLAEDV